MLRSKRPEQRRPKGGLLVGRKPTKTKDFNINKTISAEDLFNIAFGFGISASGNLIVLVINRLIASLYQNTPTAGRFLKFSLLPNPFYAGPYRAGDEIVTSITSGVKTTNKVLIFAIFKFWHL